MRVATPAWWYLRHSAKWPVVRLLRPLSWIWARVTARRLQRSTPFDPGVPVICVGNVTMGGSGKTPVVRALASHFQALGVECHVLMRGYGGREPGPRRVRATDSVDDVGDEALMLAQTSPVWIAKNRATGAEAAAAAGAQIILMDDGFQNPTVLKALSILVIDGETRDHQWPFGNGLVFPAGPMREPLSAGLRRADVAIVVLPGDLEHMDPAVTEVLAGCDRLTAHLAPTTSPPPGKQMGFAGLAKPWKMQRALKAAGCDLVDFVSLPDHAKLSEAGLRRLAARAKSLGAEMLTSEKDWMRLPLSWRERISFWPVAVRFDDEIALGRLLQSIISRP